MSQLIPLEDAAQMLGLPVDKVNEMRSNSEIFGYKDGTSWKFKMQELERVADELDITINVGATPADPGASGADAPADIAEDFELSLADGDDDDSFELDDSSSDLELADVSAADEIDEDSGELKLEGDDDLDVKTDDAVIDLDEEPAAADSGELSFGTSDIALAAEEPDHPVNVLDDDEPSKGDPSTGKLAGDDDDLMLSGDDLFADELTIQESHEDSIDLSSDFEDSSDVIIGGDDSAADVPLQEASDSGDLLVSEESDSSEISLSSSGLMDLADDDDAVIELEDPGDLDAPTELQDDDFNLTAAEEIEEAEESGSQIIALEDSEMYSDESAATLLSPSDEMEAEPMLSEDALDVGDFSGFDTGAPGMVPGAVPGSTSALPESPYTGWQIAALGLVLGLLFIGGIIGYDVARNLWLPQDQIVSGGILSMILELVGMK